MMLIKLEVMCVMMLAAACGDSRGSALSGDPQGTVVPAPTAQAGSVAVAAAAPLDPTALPPIAADDDEDDEDDESDEDDEGDDD